MARKVSNTADYFPHSARPGKTIAILQGKYGITGYAFWFKLLEALCTTENHCLDFNNPEVWQYFITNAEVDEKTAEDILGLLLQLGNIDAELWTQTRQVWCQALVDNLETCYQNRRRPKPEKPKLLVEMSHMTDISTVEMTTETTDTGISTCSSTQSKVKESRVDTLSGKPDVVKVIEYLNQKTGRKYRPTVNHASHILARFREGFTHDDFVAVIDGRIAAWGSDPKMAEYLRPETLFGTKFDSYLQIARGSKTVRNDMPSWLCPTCGKENTHTGSMCLYCKGARE